MSIKSQTVTFDLARISRVEVIDEKGRAYSRWDLAVGASIQDNGRTLKLFVEPLHAPPTETPRFSEPKLGDERRREG